jgi:hypothetical protein
MQMIPVKSSNIHSIGYEDGKLKVQFRNGSEYEYLGVTEAEHAEFMDAESKGRWLNQFIAQRAGIVRTKTPEARPVKADQSVKAESKPSQASFAGGVMRSQLNRTSRTVTFRVAK